MSVSAAMKDHLASNVCFCCEIWKIEAVDGTIVGRAAHTRNLLYNGVTYYASPVEPKQSTRKIGLDPDTVDLSGVLDTNITEADIIGGKWRRARITKEIVCYTDLTLGYAQKMVGFAGEFSIRNGTFTVEMRSLSNLLQQDIGELTSPIDRNRRPEDLGVSMAPFTFARTVTAVTDRRRFTVGGGAQVDNYFRYGRAEWTGGANNGLKMEIKSNVGNAIDLHLPMRSTIAIGDTVSLIAGYDGTRVQARDKFAAAVQFNAEPDLPGIKSVISYPGE